MIASTQITETKIFAFITVLVFKLLSWITLFIDRKKAIETVKTQLFKKIASFTGKLLQNYK